MKKLLTLLSLLLVGCTITVTPTPEEEISADFFEIYLVALEDGGDRGELIGCGDSLVMVHEERESIASTQEDFVQMALEKLLETNAPYSEDGELYSALSASQLSVDEVNILADGSLEVELLGQLLTGGVCDDPRVTMQLIRTLEANSSADSIKVLLNGEVIAQN